MDSATCSPITHLGYAMRSMPPKITIKWYASRRRKFCWEGAPEKKENEGEKCFKSLVLISCWNSEFIIEA